MAAFILNRRVTGAKSKAETHTGSLAELDHEGAVAGHDVVGGADAREDAVRRRQLARLRRHVAAHLRQYHRYASVFKYKSVRFRI